MTDPLDTWKSKEEDAIIARSEEASSKLSCFRCGDGSTPLYCLNCANDELQAKCERLEGEIVDTRQKLPTTAQAMVYQSLLMKYETLEARLSEARRLLGDDFFEENPGKWRQRRDQWLKGGQP